MGNPTSEAGPEDPDASPSGERPSAPVLDPTELYRLKVLEGVPLRDLALLVAAAELRELEPGEVLLAQGDSNRTMYMVLDGRLAVHLDAIESEPLAELGAGQTVGELSVLDERPTSAFVVAAAPSRLLAVDQDSFWRLVEASHDFAVNLLVLLAERLRTNNSAVATNVRLQRAYRQSALVDAMTSLYNRRWLEESMPRFVARFSRSTSPMSVLMLDVDHFKSWNDRFGHAAGDRVLVAVAHTLRKSLRPTDLAARYGGEEFAVILPETDEAGAFVAAERVRTAVRALELTDEAGMRYPQVTISIGGARLKPRQTMANLLAEADEALYASKHGGRDRVTYAD